MTAKDKLRQAVEELSELEAKETLAFIADRRGQDPVIAFFQAAPEDDEPSTSDEDRGADEAWAEYQRGESVSLDEIRRELG